MFAITVEVGGLVSVAVSWGSSDEWLAAEKTQTASRA